MVVQGLSGDSSAIAPSTPARPAQVASKRTTGLISWLITTCLLPPPPTQRFMSKLAGSSVVEVKGSHAVYVSQPQAAADVVKKAAKSASMK
jgi:hypothetical protein